MGTLPEWEQHRHRPLGQPGLLSRASGSARCPQCQWLAQIDRAEWNLVLLLLALVGAVQLAASFVLGGWASILAAALAGLFVTLWFVVPLFHRLRHQHRPATEDADLPATG